MDAMPCVSFKTYSHSPKYSKRTTKIACIIYIIKNFILQETKYTMGIIILFYTTFSNVIDVLCLFINNMSYHLKKTFIMLVVLIFQQDDNYLSYLFTLQEGVKTR